MEGSTLTHDQPRLIFETRTLGASGEVLNVDDLVETVKHFRCFDFILDIANRELSLAAIKELRRLLKTGMAD